MTSRRPQVALGPPVFLTGVDLGDFGLELRLFAKRHPQHVAAAEPELLPFGERHEPCQLQSML